MFTGLVGPIGTLQARDGQGEVTFTLTTPWSIDTYVVGESIACDGACMTVVDWHQHEMGSSFTFVASAESLSKTTLGNWEIGDRINLERALKLGDALGGHLVSGHVDGLARLTARVEENASLRLAFEVPDDLKAFVASKGSVALNGVSLTVNEVTDRSFGVNLVPHTAAVTNLGALKVGHAVNFEADTLARYVARQLQVGNV